MALEIFAKQQLQTQAAHLLLQKQTGSWESQACLSFLESQ